MRFVKTQCGCWYIHSVSDNKFLRLLDCCDERASIFLLSYTSDTTNPIVESHSVESPVGVAWLDRLGTMLMLANQHAALCNAINRAIRVPHPDTITGVPKPQEP
jgi:hypothetical protein